MPYPLATITRIVLVRENTDLVITKMENENLIYLEWVPHTRTTAILVD